MASPRGGIGRGAAIHRLSRSVHDRRGPPGHPAAGASPGLRALGDDTRLRALRFIADRPRSTQELALLVQVSESALSKHLRIMSEAGILTTRRQGYYVLYQIAPARLDAVSPSIAAYLAPAPGGFAR